MYTILYHYLTKESNEFCKQSQKNGLHFNTGKILHYLIMKFNNMLSKSEQTFSSASVPRLFSTATLLSV